MVPQIELLTLSQVAAALKVHRNTLRRWVKEGIFPAPALIGRRQRWRVADVADYLNRRFKAARG